MIRYLKRKFIYKTYRVRGNPDAVLDELTILLLSRGLVRTGSPGESRKVSFRYPSILFSSRKPVTCVSELTLEARGVGRDTEIRLGATFTKVRNFTLIAMGFIWVGLPIVFGFLQSTLPDFSPFGVLVVPTGVLVHYSVRGRVFRHLRQLVQSVEDTHGVR